MHCRREFRRIPETALPRMPLWRFGNRNSLFLWRKPAPSLPWLFRPRIWTTSLHLIHLHLWYDIWYDLNSNRIVIEMVTNPGHERGWRRCSLRERTCERWRGRGWGPHRRRLQCLVRKRSWACFACLWTCMEE